MAPSRTLLSETPAFDKTGDCLRVIIETPKGSANKYDFDPDCNCFELSTALPEGMTFPYDFGFVPSTVGDDGDPLDVLVLMQSPAIPGCAVRARLIGGIEAKQKKKHEDWIRNDRLVAVAVHAREHIGVTKLTDLPAHVLDEIKAFFEQYNRLHGKKFKPVGDCGPRKAMDLVQSGMKRFKRRAKR